MENTGERKSSFTSSYFILLSILDVALFFVIADARSPTASRACTCADASFPSNLTQKVITVIDTLIRKVELMGIAFLSPGDAYGDSR